MANEQEPLPTFTSLLPEKRASRIVESDKLIPLVPPSKNEPSPVKPPEQKDVAAHFAHVRRDRPLMAEIKRIVAQPGFSLLPPSRRKETASVGLHKPEHSQRRDIPSLMPVQRPSRFVEYGGKLAAIAGHETHAGKKVPGKELEKPSHAVLGDRIPSLVPPNSESHKRDLPSLMPVMREVRGPSGVTGGIGRIEPRSVMERATPLAAPSARFDDFLGMGGMSGGESIGWPERGLNGPETFTSFVHV